MESVDQPVRLVQFSAQRILQAAFVSGTANRRATAAAFCLVNFL
jgi:hypothetical protein